MKKLILLICLALSLSLNSGCNKTEGKCSSVVAFQTIDFSNYAQMKISDEKVEDKFLVINSQEEFDSNILTVENVEIMNIDFRTHTLLIGKKVLGGTLGTLVKQDVSLDCDSNKLTYDVEIKNGGYTAMGNFFFGVIIPKTTAEVIFDVTVKD